MKVYMIVHQNYDLLNNRQNTWIGKVFSDYNDARRYIDDYNDKLQSFKKRFGIEKEEFKSIINELWSKIDYRYTNWTSEEHNVVTEISKRFNLSISQAHQAISEALGHTQGYMARIQSLDLIEPENDNREYCPMCGNKLTKQ